MPRLSKIGAAALAAFGWTGLQSVTASYLVVGGGGGGAWANSGGGGGYTTNGTTSLNSTLSYTVTVGAGGSAGSSGSQNGVNGNQSAFSTFTANGGYGVISSSPYTGGAGGSGGGGYSSGGIAGVGGTNGGNGGNGTAGGASGGAGQGTTTTFLISGTSTVYSGGGGGGANTGTFGTGGAGGGGNGASVSSGAGTSGTANLGGGGGGGNVATGGGAGSGGSGVVIISYPAPQKFGGGIVTTSGSNVIHTFNTSGTLTPLSSLTASYLIVAGGGGGGNSSIGNYNGTGGGAGGLLTGTGLIIDTNSNYLVTVGAGGSSGGPGTNGTNSTFSMVTTTAIGGGRGGSGGSGVQGATGGSGGGSTGPFTALPPTTGGLGTSGQGNNGGPASQYSGSGGGGAGAVGTNYVNNSTPTGGAGVNSSISGTSVGYAGGGSGGGTPSPGYGGGQGADISGTSAATAGTSSTGGGGGGGANPTSSAANGGSGVVIISYAGSTQQMAGGTVTISGGNVIHTFTSSGYLTPIKYVNNSLRFRASNSAFLSRTNPTAGNTTTFTFSSWVKRGQLNASNATQYLFSGGSSANVAVGYGLVSTADALGGNLRGTGGTNYFYETSAVFRDPAAWYHVVFAVDTTQATSSNRMKLYVNGVLQSLGTANYPPQNQTMLDTGTRYISSEVNRYYFDGYQTEVNFIDGQSLTPNSFGTFNSYGVWQPITYGGSYGTNGFYLPFTNKTSTTTLGYDFSPNGNNWTTNNISLTAGSTYDSMTDVPTLTSATAANYCVMNPLALTSTTLTNGNLTATKTATANINCTGTIAVQSGKYYWECAVTTQSSIGNIEIGIAKATVGNNAWSLSNIVVWGDANPNTAYRYGTNLGTFGASIAQGDLLGIALDMGAGTVSLYINGTLKNTISSVDTTVPHIPFWNSYANGDSGNLNFGQRPFSYTPPTGYVALNTYNL